MEARRSVVLARGGCSGAAVWLCLAILPCLAWAAAAARSRGGLGGRGGGRMVARQSGQHSGDRRPCVQVSGKKVSQVVVSSVSMVSVWWVRSTGL